MKVFTTKRADVVCVDIGGLTICYHNNNRCEDVTVVGDAAAAAIENIQALIDAEVTQLRVIARKFEWQIEGDGEDFHAEFTRMAKEAAKVTTWLSFQDFRLPFIPAQLKLFLHVTSLNLSGNRLVRLPVEIRMMLDLEQLYLQDNQLSELPDLSHLPLRILDLQRSGFRCRPEWAPNTLTVLTDQRLTLQ